MKKILLVVDIQKEYSTQGRPFYINGINEMLRHAKKILAYAREHDWEIIHVIQIQTGEVFALKSEYSQVVEGFEAKSGEVVYIKNHASCYSNKYFSQYFERLKNREIMVIGCGLPEAIALLMVNASQMGNSFTLLKEVMQQAEMRKFFEEQTERMNVTSRFVTMEEVI